MTATPLTRNKIVKLERVIGNLEPIGFQLLDIAGAPIDITGLTLSMELIATATGTVKLAAGGCTIDTAASGLGHYSPAAIDVDTAGEYAIYVNDTGSTPNRRWPYDGARWLLNVKAKTAA